MLPKRFLIIAHLTITSVLAAACTPGASLPGGTVSAQPPVSTDTANSTAVGVVVEETPMSEAELTLQPTGETEPGAATPGPDATSETTPSPDTVEPGPPVAYVDDTYKFRVDHPENFVVRPLTSEQMAQLTPSPIAGFAFLNPMAASSAATDQEPADLELRVFTADLPASQGGQPGLDAWLVAQGFLPADGSVVPTLWETEHVSGEQVCSSTMIAPPCAYFVLGAGLVYQLRPVTLEGEAIANSFELLP
jgi:hypothetical protein